jgi:type IX secretion system PorP/SprF family membrane protein
VGSIQRLHNFIKNQGVMKRSFWMFLFFLLYSLFARAQQGIQYSQYVFDGLYINPAYSGYNDNLYINTFYRSQWTGVEGSPQTTSIAVDNSANNGKVGLGLMFQNDIIGAQSSTSAYANYAYRIQLDELENSKVSFGLGFGFIESGINGSKLNATQNNDSYVPSDFQSVFLPDARFGVLFTSNKFFIGASVDNILAKFIHNSAENQLLVPIPKPNEYLNFGVLLSLGSDVKFKPSVLIRDNPDNPTNMDLNAFLLFADRFSFGGTYRRDVHLYNKANLSSGLQNSKGLVAVTQFYINDSFRAGYAFDYSLSKIGTFGYGSHELSVTLILKKKSTNNSSETNFR